jgi:hypothetical protein
MPANVIYGDMYVGGNFTCQTFTCPTNSIPSAAIDSNNPIAATKQEHQYLPGHRQTGNVAAATDEVHEAYAAGTINAFRAKIRTAPAAANSYTIDLKKNGTSVLSAPIAVDSTTTPNAVLTGTVTTTTYAAGDRLEVVVAAVAGTTWGTGLFAGPVLREASGA